MTDTTKEQDNTPRFDLRESEVVTDEGIRAVLEGSDDERKKQLRHVGHDHDAGALGAGDNHVGRNLEGKQQPLHPMEEIGPNPNGDRLFVEQEFQGMFMFDPEGNPAFNSITDGDGPPDVIKINIATKLPAYVTDPNGTIKPMLDGRKRRIFEGKDFSEVFEPASEELIQEVKDYAKRYEKTYGIKVDVQIDHPDPDPHVTLMTYRMGKASNLNGFASFPGGMKGWPDLANYAHKPGFVILNADNMERNMTKEGEKGDLFNHEQDGHSQGSVHPHDLARYVNLTKKDTMELTTMAYTDLRYRPFEEDRDSVVWVGPMDLGKRRWVKNPPEINAGNRVYDLAKHNKQSIEENAHTRTFQRTRLLPAAPIFAHGKNNEMRGTAQGDDFLDTNPGYSSRIEFAEPEKYHPSEPLIGEEGEAAFKPAIRQKFVMMEGHLDRVYGIAGNNTIIAAKNGDQEIHPGTGNSQVQFLYADMKGEKTLFCEGKDTLVLSDAIMRDCKNFRAEQDGDDMVLNLNEGEATIRLSGQAKGQGISTFKVIDANGQTLVEEDVSKASPQEFERKTALKALSTIVVDDLLRQSPLWTERVDQQASDRAKAAEQNQRG